MGYLWTARTAKSGDRRPVPRSIAIVTALTLLLGLVVSANVSAAPAASAATGTDGLTVNVSPTTIMQGSGTAFTLQFTDANTSGGAFDSYLLRGLPSTDWVVRNAGIPIAPNSTEPPIYILPRTAAAAGQITILPPPSYSGSLSNLLITRTTNSANLVTDFSNGTFDYIGTSMPTLPASTTSYTHHNPTTIVDCGVPQYGPCEGQYSIWPTAVLHGFAGHYNNRWADLRSITSPLSQASLSSALLCSNVTNPNAGFFNQLYANYFFTNVTTVSSLQASNAGKILIVNGSTVAAPNNIIFTTVTGLAPNSYYSFSGNVANLSVEQGVAPVSVQFYLQSNPSDSGMLVGTSNPLPRQSDCPTSSTVWTNLTGVFYTGSSTQVTIGVRNNVNGMHGNDLAIDNLSLRAMAYVSVGLTVAPRQPSLAVSKTAAPASGATVGPNGEVTYRVTATNTGNVPLTNVVVNDDLTDVFDQAPYVAGSASAVRTPAASATAPTVSGNVLSWTGDLAIGASVALEYRVRVGSTPGISGSLINRVTATGSDAGATVQSNCAVGTETGCFTTHTVVDSRPATITLRKIVTNDDGGTAAAADFTLSATGATSVTGTTGSATVTAKSITAGSYTLGESGPAGYSLASLTCALDAAGTQPVTVTDRVVSILPTQHVYCTFRNSDDPAKITLVKEVINSFEGQLLPEDFTLTATGPTTVTGASGAAAVIDAPVKAGTYELSEGHEDGYILVDLACFRDSTRAQVIPITDRHITLTLGATAYCVYTNHDLAPIVLPVTGGAGDGVLIAIGGLLLVGGVVLVSLAARARTRNHNRSGRD